MSRRYSLCLPAGSSAAWPGSRRRPGFGSKDYYSTFLQRLENVSRDEIIAASKKYFHPENAYILVVTDRSMKAQLFFNAFQCRFDA